LMPLPSDSAPLRMVNSGEGGSGTVLLFATPAGASLTLNGVDMGQAPLEVTNLQIAKAHTVKVAKPGYRAQSSQITFSSQSQSATLKIKLIPLSNPSAGSSPVKTVPAAVAETCVASGGKLSVMPIGGTDCQVRVGSVELGLAPFFQKSSPMGKCNVVVTCDQERSYIKTIAISADGSTKLIIQPTDWN
jgi:PEGA domain